MSKFAPVRANTGQSIRGKISAPIPIPDDEEFPIRSPGTGIATPLGNEGIEKQLRMPNIGHGIAVTDFTEPRAPSTQRSYIEGPMQPRHVLQTTLRNSQLSQPSGGSSIEKPQKKKTTLKSVLGRLFGTKKGRNGASRSSTRNTTPARAGQHRSDPSALSRNNNAEVSSQKRSASLPINEYNRALRSHSPFTETFPLQNPSESSNRSSTLAERRARTRRATTPSRLFEPGTAAHDGNGLAPRPASSHARDSRLLTDDERFAIGYAVTSGSHPNRRSRSLDGLKQTAQGQVQNLRRRSDEIRYWRQSYDIDALSPMSSPKAGPDPQVAVEHEEHAEAGEIEREEDKTAPRPFNFGPMGEMAGMKITEAASLETRVSRMEKKMHQMEKMIFQMQGMSTAHGSTFREPSRGDRNTRSFSSKRPTGDETSEYSLPRHVDRFRVRESDQHSSLYSRPSTRETQGSNLETFSTSRPLSTTTTTTVRGIPSSPPLPSDKDANLSGEKYNKLVSFITAEQQARLRLENIVDRLQTQLKEQIHLQSASRPTSLSTHHPNSHLQSSSILNPQSYPTPTPERSNTLGTKQRQLVPQQSAFEADDSSDDEGYQNDVFQTPSEEVGHYDIDDEVDPEEGDDEDERSGKRAVRITSLSELTMGKGRSGVRMDNF